jgi:hypothetical protein
MTAIVHDLVIYNEQYFDVLISGRLFNAEKKLGLMVSKGATYNPSGYHCDFEIRDSQLFLSSLSFCTVKKPNSGFLGLWAHPPIINNSNPIIEKEAFEGVWNILYEGIYLRIPFSGQLKIGDRLPYGDGLDDRDYKEIITLDFKNGKIIT